VPETSLKRVSPAAALAVVAALSLRAAMVALVSVKQVSVKHGPKRMGRNSHGVHATTITVLQSFDDRGRLGRRRELITCCLY